MASPLIVDETLLVEKESKGAADEPMVPVKLASEVSRSPVFRLNSPLNLSDTSCSKSPISRVFLSALSLIEPAKGRFFPAPKSTRLVNLSNSKETLSIRNGPN